MNDVVVLYEIVPVDSGIEYICYDEAIDYYYRAHKSKTDKNALAFDTKEAAEEYIQTHFPMSANAYKAEEFGYSLSKAPFKIRTQSINKSLMIYQDIDNEILKKLLDKIEDKSGCILSNTGGIVWETGTWISPKAITVLIHELDKECGGR